MSRDTVVPLQESGTPTDGEHRQSSARSREPIQLLETTPKDNWFVKLKDEQGRWMWYLRLEITGWLPPRYGPFRSRHVALRFLDAALHQLQNFDTDLKNLAQDEAVQRPYHRRWDLCILEDELGSHYLGNGQDHPPNSTTATQSRKGWTR